MFIFFLLCLTSGTMCTGDRFGTCYVRYTLTLAVYLAILPSSFCVTSASESSWSSVNVTFLISWRYHTHYLPLFTRCNSLRSVMYSKYRSELYCLNVSINRRWSTCRDCKWQQHLYQAMRYESDLIAVSAPGISVSTKSFIKAVLTQKLHF